LPDTNLKTFDPLVKLPNFNMYDLWFRKWSGAAILFPSITEFIARSESKSDMTSKEPLIP